MPLLRRHIFIWSGGNRDGGERERETEKWEGEGTETEVRRRRERGTDREEKEERDGREVAEGRHRSCGIRKQRTTGQKCGAWPQRVGDGALERGAHLRRHLDSRRIGKRLLSPLNQQVEQRVVTGQ